ncbi:hypothetical protein GCM10022216_32110 [Sphingobacterium kyonggiense]|uniref:Heparinase II/III-like protein n=1 Tax=Sphingobacterium kyonggiense TaxID=714075 RepID=A0ABP7Z3Q9_9SPHI
MRKLLIILNTLKFLKLSQYYFQILYRLKKRRYLKGDQKVLINIDNSIRFKNSIRRAKNYFGDNKFRFLNLSKSFNENIDWNFNGFGKLWNYNLEYFDYLFQEEVTVEDKLDLINNFYIFSIKNKRPLEPYPISLRAINIIKFSIENKIENTDFFNYLVEELAFLHNNYEKHLLGNHLLENAFCMFLAGNFFNKKEWVLKAKKILIAELNEQILNDGGHFELSPMYHNIIFYRILELVDWYGGSKDFQIDFDSFLRNKASKMMSWIKQVSFDNYIIPLFNDAAHGVAYEVRDLLSYSKSIGIEDVSYELTDSGYRTYKTKTYEIKIDVGQIGARYQPGHAHADALSFQLMSFDKPIFVEYGTSTYNIGRQRDLERSTSSHNTVVVNNKNQSEVWGGFRVGNRAKVDLLRDESYNLQASHNGYKKFGITHVRNFSFNEEEFIITDEILGNASSSIAYFHIAEGKEILLDKGEVKIFDRGQLIITIAFKNYQNIRIENYSYAEEFNLYKTAQKILTEFKGNLETSIRFY